MNDQQQQAEQGDHGRDAKRPGDIPAPGWRDVARRLTSRVVEGNLAIVAAGAAFFALIATFPALLVLLQVYGLVFDSGQVAEQLDSWARQLEPEAISLVAYLLRGLSESDRAGLGFGMLGAALTTLWGASLGLRALMRSLNVAYGEREKRSVVVRYGVSLLLTAGAIAVAFCMGFVLLSVPLLTRWLKLSPLMQRFVFDARWPPLPSCSGCRCWSFTDMARVARLRVGPGSAGCVARHGDVARRHRCSRLVRCRLAPVSPGLWLGRNRRAGAGVVSYFCLRRAAGGGAECRARTANAPGHHRGR